MATCKDCFHWNACKKMLETYWGHCVPSDYEGGADRCEDFISTANVIVLTGIIEGHPDPVGEPGEPGIDLVRCKNCRHKVRTSDGEYNPEDIVCDYHMSDGFNENDYCSYGEREMKGGGEK